MWSGHVYPVRHVRQDTLDLVSFLSRPVRPLTTLCSDAGQQDPGGCGPLPAWVDHIALMQVPDFPGYGSMLSEDVQETSQSRVPRARKRLALRAPLAYYRLQKFLTGVWAPLEHTTAALYLLRVEKRLFWYLFWRKRGEDHSDSTRSTR